MVKSNESSQIGQPQIDPKLHAKACGLLQTSDSKHQFPMSNI